MTKNFRLRVLYWSFFMLGSYCCLKAFTHKTCPCTENTRLRHPLARACVQLSALRRQATRTRARVLSARAHLGVRMLRVTLHVCVSVCVARNTSLPLPQVSTPPVVIFRNTDLRVLNVLLRSVLIFACQIPGNHAHSATRHSPLARDIMRLSHTLSRFPPAHPHAHCLYSTS